MGTCAITGRVRPGCGCYRALVGVEVSMFDLRIQKLLVACAIISASTLSAPCETNIVSTPSYREYLRCGPNSLFLFLHLLGRSDVSLLQLEHLEISSEGSSLLTLCNAANELGVNAEIRRYRSEEIEFVPLPAIIQFKNYSSSLTPYHFNVVYRIDAERYYMIDGTSGARFSGLLERLPYFWTGYAMVEKRSQVSRMFERFVSLPVAGALVLINIVIATVSIRSGKRQAAMKAAEL